MLGPGLQLVSILLEPETDSTIDAVQWIADNPDRANLTQVFFLLAMRFRSAPRSSTCCSRGSAPRASPTPAASSSDAASSAVAGYETLAVALAQDGRFDLTVLAEVVEEMSSPPAIAMLLVFIPFAFFGLLTSAAALWRSRAVPRAAALLITTFIVVDLFLNEGLGLVSSSAAHLIGFVAAGWIAWSVVRAG